MKPFPRTTVGGISLPRLLIGSNWFLGWSHRGAAADAAIRERFPEPRDFWPTISVFLDAGVDALMAPISTTPIMEQAIDYAEQKSGKKIIRIDTPGVNVEDTPEGRRDAEALIKHSAEIGSDLCLLHHTCVEKLLDKGSESIPRLPDYLSMIRDAGMIPGLSAHMPETVVYTTSRRTSRSSTVWDFSCRSRSRAWRGSFTTRKNP